MQKTEQKRPLIIAIEGNIGSGKSTLLEKMRQLYYENKDPMRPKIFFMPEPVDVWDTIADLSGETILSKFYREPAKYAFPFQIMAYSTRLAALQRAVRDSQQYDIIICERSLEADRNIFAKMLFYDKLIDDMSYLVYQQLYNDTSHEFKLDGVVYVDVTPDNCLFRIEKRARMGENKISLAYLQKCKTFYDDWLIPNVEDFEDIENRSLSDSSSISSMSEFFQNVLNPVDCKDSESDGEEVRQSSQLPPESHTEILLEEENLPNDEYGTFSKRSQTCSNTGLPCLSDFLLLRNRKSSQRMELPPILYIDNNADYLNMGERNSATFARNVGIVEHVGDVQAIHGERSSKWIVRFPDAKPEEILSAPTSLSDDYNNKNIKKINNFIKKLGSFSDFLIWS